MALVGLANAKLSTVLTEDENQIVWQIEFELFPATRKKNPCSDPQGILNLAQPNTLF